MNILYIAPEISVPGTHGGSSHVHEVATSLQRIGHHVTVLCRKTAEQPFSSTHAINFIRIPVIGGGFFKNLSYVFFTLIITLFLFLSNRVDFVLERGRIFGGAGIFIASLFNKPRVYEMIEPYTEVPLYTGELSRTSFLYVFIRKWHNAIMKRSTRVLITHKSFLTTVPKSKALIVDSGVNPHKFTPQIDCRRITQMYNLTKGKTLLYVGSFQPWHACENLIKAFHKAAKKDKKLKLLMIGTGKKLTVCKKLVNTLKLDKQVVFTGPITFSTLPCYINASDICFALFDRDYSPFKKLNYFYSPIKIHEYKACGKAIIASDFGNLTRLVKNNVNGLVVNEHQTSTIVQAITKLSTHPALLKKIGKQNRSEALRTYNWDVINKKILREALHEKKS